jgi:hypothetical protein
MMTEETKFHDLAQTAYSVWLRLLGSLQQRAGSAGHTPVGCRKACAEDAGRRG